LENAGTSNGMPVQDHDSGSSLVSPVDEQKFLRMKTGENA